MDLLRRTGSKKVSERPTQEDVSRARNLLREAGYVVVPEKMGARYLLDMGFDVMTVFDVGVNKGTPGLYRAFKDKEIVLIDPRKESIEATERRFPKISFISEVCAAGSTYGTATLHIPDRGGRSSIHARAPLTAGDVSQTLDVPVRRLDYLAKTYSLRGPFGIKIDTEGYELEVLKGATEILPNTQFVIAEVSVKRRFENGYRFSEIIIFMRDHGFELLDTLTFKRRPSSWIDCLFVRSDNAIFG